MRALDLLPSECRALLPPLGSRLGCDTPDELRDTLWILERQSLVFLSRRGEDILVHFSPQVGGDIVSSSGEGDGFSSLRLGD